MSPAIDVIVNASAGTGYAGEWRDELTEKFRHCGLEANVILARSGAEMIDAARTALSRGAPVVVAGGGDGTLNAVASVLSGSRTALGVLPLGTLNHFAKDLQIPLDLDAAIRNIADGHLHAVDVGEVNGKLFLNNSSLGLYPDIVRDREKQQQQLGRGKWPAFLWAMMSALLRYPFLHVRLSIEGADIVRRTPFIFIGNNEYIMEGFSIGTRERLDAGLLSLYVAQRPGRLGLLRLALSALMKRLSQAKDFDSFTTREIQIDTHQRRLRVSTDGEVTIMATPLVYRIRPAALQVVVPRPAQTAS